MHRRQRGKTSYGITRIGGRFLLTTIKTRQMKNKRIVSVSASLPSTVRSFTWVRNHHYVQLEDEKGNTIKLHAGGVLRGECTECKAISFCTRHEGAMVCPHCLGKMSWEWSKIQLAFLPEHEAQFMGFDAPQIGKKPLTMMQRAWLVMYTAITKQAPKASSAPPITKSEVIPEPIGDDETTPIPKG